MRSKTEYEHMWKLTIAVISEIVLVRRDFDVETSLRDYLIPGCAITLEYMTT